MQFILIDDEPLALDLLKSNIEKVRANSVSYTFTSFNTKEHKQLLFEVDAVFLDIHLSTKSGLQLAEEINEICPTLNIIFVTAYDQYAIQAFEVHALDYLLKPVQLNRLEDTINRVQALENNNRQTGQNNRTLHLHVGNSFSIQSGDSISPIKWRTSKSEELFLYLLHHKGAVMRKDHLSKQFWPEFSNKKAYSQLYITIYYIRKSLEPYGTSLSITSSLGGYTLLANDVTTDLHEWEYGLDQLQNFEITNRELFIQHLENYPGNYLEHYGYDWAYVESKRIEDLWIDTAEKIAESYEEEDSFEDAAKWFIGITERQPGHIHATLALMNIYHRFSYSLLIEHQYSTYKAAVHKIHPDISQWYDMWKVRHR